MNGHPLRDSFVKVLRAREHLVEFKSSAHAYIQNEYRLAMQINQFHIGQKLGERIGFITPSSPYPVKLSILVGETIQHLRTALDYLIYQLAILDSGEIKNGTQFPIEDSAAKFDGRRRSYLRGVNDSHAEAVERLQPYNGVYWTQRLRTLSNPEKHREPILPVYSTSMHWNKIRIPADIISKIDDGILLEFGGDPNDPTQSATMQLHVVFRIGLDDGKPAVQTLEHIESKVSQTLNEFAPDFQIPNQE